MNAVIIANPWEQGLYNPTSKHHVGRELVNMGHEVLWIDGTGMRVPRITSASDHSRMLSKILSAVGGDRFKVVQGSRSLKDGHAMRVCAPLVLPFPGSRSARRLNGWIYERAIRKARIQEAVLINFLPVCAEAMRRHRGRKVYYCVDRWDSFDRYDSTLMAELDEDCCRAADVVIASASDLADRCRRFNDHVELLTHGVSYDHFRQWLYDPSPERPADMPSGRVIGFFGLLSEWVDQALVQRVALETGAQVVLIGSADVDVASIEKSGGVTLLGSRPFSELPNYVAHFDVGIIPFLVNDLTRAVNPIKLREMLAAGCPVVSTALPEVEQYAGLPGGCVRIGHSDDEFIAHVNDLLEEGPTPSARRAMSETMAGETWRSKVMQLLDVLDSMTTGQQDNGTGK